MARRRIDILKPLLALPEPQVPAPAPPEYHQETKQRTEEIPTDAESVDDSSLTPKATTGFKRKNNSKTTKPAKKKKTEALTIDNFI